MNNIMNKYVFFLAQLLAGLMFLTTVHAETNKPVISPDKIPGTTLVDAEGVIGLVTSISDLIIVDARIKSDRKQGYIEGSVSLPDIDTNCDTLANIIPSKTTPTLYYCNGVKCGRSAKSVKIAMDCGYNKIYWFRGGYEEWQAKGFPVLTN